MNIIRKWPLLFFAVVVGTIEGAAWRGTVTHAIQTRADSTEITKIIAKSSFMKNVGIDFVSVKRAPYYGKNTTFGVVGREAGVNHIGYCCGVVAVEPKLAWELCNGYLWPKYASNFSLSLIGLNKLRFSIIDSGCGEACQRCCQPDCGSVSTVSHRNVYLEDRRVDINSLSRSRTVVNKSPVGVNETTLSNLGLPFRFSVSEASEDRRTSGAGRSEHAYPDAQRPISPFLPVVFVLLGGPAAARGWSYGPTWLLLAGWTCSTLGFAGFFIWLIRSVESLGAYNG